MKQTHIGQYGEILNINIYNKVHLYNSVMDKWIHIETNINKATRIINTEDFYVECPSQTRLKNVFDIMGIEYNTFSIDRRNYIFCNEAYDFDMLFKDKNNIKVYTIKELENKCGIHKMVGDTVTIEQKNYVITSVNDNDIAIAEYGSSKRSFHISDIEPVNSFIVNNYIIIK